MTTKKIYGPWIKWDGGECPVPPETLVEVKLRNGQRHAASYAVCYDWSHDDVDADIVEYRTVTEQADLEAAEKLLRDNGYAITQPAKPLTFDDVEPLTEAPRVGTTCWTIGALIEEGVYKFAWSDIKSGHLLMKRRLVYATKEHALVAARHIFGLKGGEL